MAALQAAAQSLQRLAERAAAGDELPAWTQRGALRLPPDPATPLVLVGPGTGSRPCARFLAAPRGPGGTASPVHVGRVLSGCPSGGGRERCFLGVAPARRHMLSQESWTGLGLGLGVSLVIIP